MVHDWNNLKFKFHFKINFSGCLHIFIITNFSIGEVGRFCFSVKFDPPLWHFPTSEDHCLNKLLSTLLEVASTEVPASLAKCFLRRFLKIFNFFLWTNLTFIMASAQPEGLYYKPTCIYTICACFRTNFSFYGLMVIRQFF